MILNKDTMRQRGFILFDKNMNARQWINDAKAQGYVVMLCGNYAELWK